MSDMRYGNVASHESVGPVSLTGSIVAAVAVYVDTLRFHCRRRRMTRGPHELLDHSSDRAPFLRFGTPLPPDSERLADPGPDSPVAQFASITGIGPGQTPALASLPRQRLFRGG
jgi:hypothetical protein